MRFILRAAAFALALSVTASAQIQDDVLPGESGDALRTSIVRDFKSSPRGYSPARDQMYGTIDRVTIDGVDGVIGIYSGFFVPLDGLTGSGGTAGNPRADVFNQPNENTQGLNAEHSFPQSQGAGSEPARSDLHHLFPSKVDVNSARGSKPFADIPDAQTQRWYRDGTSQTATPSAGEIDEFSESSGNAFEPRESVKGDIARAQFYFYTIYGPQGSGVADASFFEGQRRTLYDWHVADPIDEAEYGRTQAIAGYQGRPNPFVLDSTLARRAFFPDIVVGGTDAEDDAVSGATLALSGANPFTTEARLTLSLSAAADVQAQAFDALGRRVAVLFDGPTAAGSVPLRLNGTALAAGVYVVRVAVGDAVLTRIVVRAR